MFVPASPPSEFAFELALCARLEQTTDWLPARQPGASVASPGSRTIDVCVVVPGPGFDNRARITNCATPAAAIESDVGVDNAVLWRDGFDYHPDHVRYATGRVVEVGFSESERRRSREHVHRVVRYPDDWFARLIGIENKPDLGSPGDLLRQSRLDVSLAVFDEMILMTKSYVTGAYLDRVPEEVGVWRFDPDTGDREVAHEPRLLSPDSTGAEPVKYYSLYTNAVLVSPAERRTVRLRLAERVYGKGWCAYDLPGCVRARVDADGRPVRDHSDHVVDPGSEHGPDCPAFKAADPPEPDRDGLRESRTDRVTDPPDAVRRQSGLDWHR